MIESFFGKFARVCLRGIRVKIKDELVQRIYQYVLIMARNLFQIFFQKTCDNEEIKLELISFRTPNKNTYIESYHCILEEIMKNKDK